MPTTRAIEAAWRDPRRRAMGVSLLVSFFMLTGKVGAYLITDSSAIFSDAAESVIHLLATGLVAASLWYAVQPPDPEHPYGHRKAAYFASGFEGGLILLAALVIVVTAVRDLIVGPQVESLGLGLLIIAVLCCVNGALGWYLQHEGRKHGSLVLVSNGKHVVTDMWTSLGVLVGVGLVWMTDVVWLDPVVAILVALNILHTAWGLLRQAFSGLMDAADEEETSRIIAALNSAQEAGRILNFHQLRHRRIENQLWIEYHLLFPAHLSITEAHERSHDVEEIIDDLFPEDRVYVTAHLEPSPHRKAHPSGHREPADPLG